MSAAKFSVFRREVEHWVRRFGLTDWKVSVVHNKKPNERRAGIAYNTENRSARITYFSKQTGPQLMEQSPDKSALHEVLHLLLADAMAVAARRGDNHDDAIREEHRVIERLMGAIK